MEKLYKVALVKGKKNANYKFVISEYLKVKEKDDLVYFIPSKVMTEGRNSITYTSIKKHYLRNFVEKDKIKEKMEELIQLEKANLLEESKYFISLIDKLDINNIKIQEIN